MSPVLGYIHTCLLILNCNIKVFLYGECFQNIEKYRLVCTLASLAVRDREKPVWTPPSLNQPERLLIDAFSRPARKDATDQNLLRQNFIAYIFGSQEGKRPAPSPKNESPFNNETETPSLFRRVIFRLGRITPWLAAAHGRADVHGKNRVQVVVNTLGSCADYLFTNLEHRMSAPSCDGECGGGFPQFPLFY